MKRSAPYAIGSLLLASQAPASPPASPSAASASVAPSSRSSSSPTRARQTQPPAVQPQQLPPGHPPMNPSGLPVGHPPVAPSALPPGHADILQETSSSIALRDQDLARGEVLVMARTPDGKPVQGSKVRITRWSVGQSDPVRKETLRATLDDKGRAGFHRLRTDPQSAYQVTVDYQQVHYRSALFQLNFPQGVRVQQVVYPATDDIDQALVGMQAFVMMEPAEHGLHVQQLFRIANLSDHTWRCRSIPVRLPKGFRAVSQSESTAPLRYRVVPGQGIVLEGFAPPGPSEVGFSYDLPYPRSDQASWRFGMPPRVAEARAIVVASQGMEVSFPGLGATVQQTDEEGRRLLLASKAQEPGQDQIEQIEISATGLPVPGWGRWVALGLAVTVLLAGLIEVVRRDRRSRRGAESNDEAVQREQLLQRIARIRKSWNEQENPEKQVAEELEKLAGILDDE